VCYLLHLVEDLKMYYHLHLQNLQLNQLQQKNYLHYLHHHHQRKLKYHILMNYYH
tara:strand:- start:150 stop:314 length:165 start_codon:yes stop_codon:yes gene_type:complete